MADARPARAVLVVDDDRDLRELVADVVEGSGRRVFTAGDGADALRQIEIDGIPRPCVVLLDWFMRPMGGAAFLEQLAARADAAEFRVLVLSASTGTPHEGLSFPVRAILRKPFGIEQLLGTLDQLG